MEILFGLILGLGFLLLPFVLLALVILQRKQLRRLEGRLEKQENRLSLFLHSQGRDETQAAARASAEPATAASTVSGPSASEAPLTTEATKATKATETVEAVEAAQAAKLDARAKATEQSASQGDVHAETLAATPMAQEEAPSGPEEASRPESEAQTKAKRPEIKNDNPLPPLPPEPRKISLEERLGARLPVWLAAACMALAAVFLVKISFDRGWLSPPVRVALGTLFGTFLLAAGERVRRAQPHLAQGFTAGGVAILFVAFFAATSLYGLVPIWLGFGLLALVTAVAVLLSLRHGPMVAILGLVGGFLTPLLIAEEQPALLFGYLLLLQAGLVVLTRVRKWWPLGLLTLAASLIWIFSSIPGSLLEVASPGLGLFLLATAFSFALSVSSLASQESSARLFGVEVHQLFAWAATGATLLASASWVQATSHGSMEWLFLALLSLGCLILARKRSDYHGLAWMAATIVGLQLWAWGGSLEAAHHARFLTTTGLLGALFAAGSLLACRGAFHPGRWTSLSGASATTFLLIAHHGAPEAELSWGWVALAIAAFYASVALPFARRRLNDPRAEAPLTALAATTTMLVGLALPMELDRQWLTVAWALQLLALLWLAETVRLPVLRRLAWALLALVGVRLLLNPEIFRYQLGSLPFWNGLLFGYGVPIAALGMGARLAGRQGDHRLRQALLSVNLALVAAFLALQVRHYFHPESLARGDANLAEWGAYLVAALGLALATLALSRRWAEPLLERGGLWLACGGLLLAALGPGLVANPVFTRLEVGEWVLVNRLLLAYGLPSLLMVALAKRLAVHQRPLAMTFGLGGLFYLWLLVTLEVRQAFRGTLLFGSGASDAENYAYSFAWLVLGIVLVVTGIRRRSTLLRYASLAMMSLAVIKVFLFDTARLGDFYRVLSFFALGVSLFLLAFIYQRYVFPRGQRQAALS